MLRKIESLYLQSSKHSNYQILHPNLKKLISNKIFQKLNRYEKERFQIICSNIKIKDALIMDLGGNTGYFTIASLYKKCKKIIFFEGNKVHCEFVKLAAKKLNLDKKIIFENKYFNNQTVPKKVDIIFNLNVFHHLGDDFDVAKNPRSCLKNSAKIINHLSYFTKHMVFQMGYCWKGNIKKPLFKHGLKKEMIDWLKKSTKNNWKLDKVFIPDRSNGKIVYQLLNSKNLKRKENLGEFLNRPLFFLNSLNCDF